jgi:(E)-4-hydroxy-3-methylbut-2-enyl-diphosphate synthase
MRRVSKPVKVGKIVVGGSSDISVQSMLSVPWSDIEGNISQALSLEAAGCDIIRVAVPNAESVRTIFALKQKIKIPVVADIHFDYRLAVAAADAGADKIRINPGNIGTEGDIKAVIKKCKEKNIAVRVGVNSGSVEKKILAKYGSPTPEALCQSALYNISLLEKYDFENIIVSVKSSNLADMLSAYRLLAQKCIYPLNLGLTEAGTQTLGVIRSHVCVGVLLMEGIGDTIRISITADPVKEVEGGINLLKALNLYRSGIELISCPTCGRASIDVIKIAEEVENLLAASKKRLKVAVMGCAVNGLNEARSADIGISGGNGAGVIFKNGKILKSVDESHLVEELMKEIESMDN